MTELQTQLDSIVPLLVSSILGGLVGLERELQARWAGLRTHMLVALGAALFVVVARIADFSAGAGLGHVIQGVAAGIGFIGAGTILKLSDQREIKGLTTASSIWLAAAVGIASGLRFYVLAVTATVLALIVLAVLGRVEKHIIEPNQESKP